MKTYLINHLRVPGDIPNAEGLTYLENVEATVAPHGGKWLAQGPADVMEGTWPGAVVLMEFPNREAAMAWYNSAEYQAILPLRTRNAISDIVLIDELPAGFTVKAFAEKIRVATQGG
ncbi:DUF1330 domain-containing protein [Rhizobium sp. BK251]|uniref:DUF1330 domain-containing protein n=1 Tax=Rhizobium sp. BK251 TaxID=2512125 RepID=UPI0010451A6D|nr:DUF1330 domain-containing protein [Rhizobium sp. BK251]TCL73996.1 uncharacterized protein (DUF1330 family) [Rhizobium sp. BK251]